MDSYKDLREGVDDNSRKVIADVVGTSDGLSSRRGGVAVRSSGVLAVEFEVVELYL